MEIENELYVRNYRVESHSENTLKMLDTLLSVIEDMGNVGHSGHIGIFVDGDGAARIRSNVSGISIAKTFSTKEIGENEETIFWLDKDKSDAKYVSYTYDKPVECEAYIDLG